MGTLKISRVGALSMLSVLALGCVHADLEAAKRRGTASAYRELIRDHPDSLEADEAQRLLAELEWGRAREQHTVLGYKRFLKAHPNALQAREARARLEGLRWTRTRDQGTAAALRRFLTLHPDGEHARKAAALLEPLDREARLEEGSLEELRERLRHTRDPVERRALTARLDPLAFAEAQRRGSPGLYEYLEAHPAGAFRMKARVALFELDLASLLSSGRVAQARRALRDSPHRRELSDWDERIDRAEALLLSLKAAGALGARARAEHYLHSRETLEKALVSSDPLVRVGAATELGYHVTLEVLPPLLTALQRDPSPQVRRHAAEALGRVLDALPPEVRLHQITVSRRRLAREGGADVALADAVLLGLGGAISRALTRLEEADREGLLDSFGLLHWAALARRDGRTLVAGIALRRALQAAHQEAEALDEDAARRAPLSAARRLCDAFDTARFVDEAVGLVVNAPEEASDAPSELSPGDARRAGGGADEALSGDWRALKAAAEETRALTRARLQGAELILRADLPHVRTCDDRPLERRLAHAERERIEALRALATGPKEVALPALELATRRDPVEAVRREARALLDRLVQDGAANG